MEIKSLTDIYAFSDWAKVNLAGYDKPLKITPLSGGLIRVTQAESDVRVPFTPLSTGNCHKDFGICVHDPAGEFKDCALCDSLENFGKEVGVPSTLGEEK